MRTATPRAGCLRQPPSVHPVSHAAASLSWWQGGCLSSSSLLCASSCCCFSSSLSLRVTAFNSSGRRFPALPEKRLSCFASSRCASLPSYFASRRCRASHSSRRASILAQGQRHRFRWPDGHRAFTVRRWRTSGRVVRPSAPVSVCRCGRRSTTVLHGGWLPAGTLPHPAGYYRWSRQG